MIIELKSNGAIAKIDSKGAELVSFVKKQVEYIWQKGREYWPKSSPFLFPIVGGLRNNKTIIEGEEYEIPKHGFCRETEFEVTQESENKATFRYSYNQETLKVYPYKFSVALTYTLKSDSLEILYTVINLDEKNINYCIGAHPAFNVPINNDGVFEDYCLEFNKHEPFGCPVFNFDTLEIDVDNRVDLLNGGKKLMLKYNYFDSDAVIFDKINSDSVKLYNNKTNKGVKVDFIGFDSIAFWTPTKMDAPFLCVEPWNGMATRSDENDEFKTKFGVKNLNVNEQHKYKLIISPI